MFFSIREFKFFNVERASMRGKNVFHARGFDAGVINARFLQHEGDGRILRGFAINEVGRL